MISSTRPLLNLPLSHSLTFSPLTLPLFPSLTLPPSHPPSLYHSPTFLSPSPRWWWRGSTLTLSSSIACYRRLVLSISLYFNRGKSHKRERIKGKPTELTNRLVSNILWCWTIGRHRFGQKIDSDRLMSTPSRHQRGYCNFWAFHSENRRTYLWTLLLACLEQLKARQWYGLLLIDSPNLPTFFQKLTY